jgi:hypothetical protein
VAARPTRSGRGSLPALTAKRLALFLLVATPMVFNAVALWPEIAIPVPNVNDDAEHIAFIERATDALARGENVIDHWLPEIDLGFPEFFYYQHLPHLAVVAVHRALFGAVDLFTLFNVVRWVLLVGLPLTVFWSMRRLGSGDVAAAVGAAASSLLSANHRYGFEYDSYVWRGFGLYTQLWAMHLSFVALACLHRLLQRGTGLFLTVIVLTVLALSHLIYAYMMAISTVVLLLFAVRRGRVAAPLVSLAIAGLAVLAITSYFWVPFLGGTAYLSTSPFLQPEKYASYGAPAVLGWFATGELFDHGRLPVLTAVLFIGVAGAAVSRRRLELATVALLGLWLWFYSGRAAIGPLFGLLPLHDGLLFHRFIGGVDLAAILLMGSGGAFVWERLTRPSVRSLLRGLPHWQIAAAALLGGALLVPALAERQTYYAAQTTWLGQTAAAIEGDSDLRTILTTLHRLPPGRVYAGLASNWGRTLDFRLPFNSVHVYQLLAAEKLATVAPPFGGQSLNADLQFDFDDQRASQYALYNVRYVIASPSVSLPAFLVRRAVTARYVLYETPTAGYAEFVGVATTETVRTQATLFPKMRAFVNGPGPEARIYTRFEFPAAADAVIVGSMPRCGADAKIVNERIDPARLTFAATCATASPLVVKVTYHPGWQVTVDGAPVPTYMVSPSYLAFTLPAGAHEVVAEYRSAAAKGPLLAVGALTIAVFAVLQRRRVIA